MKVDGAGGLGHMVWRAEFVVGLYWHRVFGGVILIQKVMPIQTVVAI